MRGALLVAPARDALHCAALKLDPATTPRLVRPHAQAALIAAIGWFGLRTDLLPKLCAGREMLAPLAVLAVSLAVLVRDRWRARRGTTTARGETGGTLHWLTLPAVAALFMVPLWSAWASARTHGAFIGGVIPYSDAADYVRGALGLTLDGALDTWNSRRPLNAILLAARLRMSGGDLQVALYLQALLLAVASWLAARAITLDLGRAAAGLFVGGMLIFGGIFAPTTMSESLGLSLGALALAILWHAARAPTPWSIGAGMLTLSLALNARSGPFFVLPMLIVWAALALHDRAKAGRRWSAVNLGGALGGVASGFVVNGLLLRMHHGVTGASQANFSYTVYGLVHGGKGWEKAWEDLPEIASMPESQGAALVYRRAMEHLARHPGELALGLYRNVECLVFSWTENATGGALTNRPALQWMVAALAAAAGAWALRRLWTKHRDDRAFTMVLAAGMGLLASVPVIYMDGRERVFAAAFPFALAGAALALASAAGCTACISIDRDIHAAHEGFGKGAVGGIGAIVALALLHGLLPRSSPPPRAPVACPPGETLARPWIARAPARLHLTARAGDRVVPDLYVTTFRQGIYRDPNLGTNVLNGPLAALPAGTFLLAALDLETRRFQYFSSDRPWVTASDGSLPVCVVPMDSATRTVLRVTRAPR